MKNKKLFDLAKKIVKLKEKAKELGIFTGDRDLLECPKCGFMEDVAIDGRLFTVFKNAPNKDTGLEFKELGKEGNRFSCPNCRKIIILE